MIVPGRGPLSLPTLRTLPFTRSNRDVRAFRHAMAIDERRRMFRLNRWLDGQQYDVDPYASPKVTDDQDCKQMWFAGVHSDIGGGYPEKESGLAKYPLIWMIDEAVEHGLRIDDARFEKLAKIASKPGDVPQYVAPNACAMQHRSLKHIWWALEALPILPKSTRWRRWPRWSLFGWYLPLAEPRLIPTGAVFHPSVAERLRCPGLNYAPPNLTPREPIPAEGKLAPVLRALSGAAVLAAIAYGGVKLAFCFWHGTGPLLSAMRGGLLLLGIVIALLGALGAIATLWRLCRPSR